MAGGKCSRTLRNVGHENAKGRGMETHPAGLDELDSREEVFVSSQRDGADPNVAPLDPPGVDVGGQSGFVTTIREPQGFVFAELLQQCLGSQYGLHGSGQFLAKAKLVILIGTPEDNRGLRKANPFVRFGGR